MQREVRSGEALAVAANHAAVPADTPLQRADRLEEDVVVAAVDSQGIVQVALDTLVGRIAAADIQDKLHLADHSHTPAVEAAAARLAVAQHMEARVVKAVVDIREAADSALSPVHCPWASLRAEA